MTNELSKSIFLPSAEDMESFGEQLFDVLPDKCVVFLEGDLGVGKTTLVRGFMRAAGHQGTVKSPTYNIIEEYCIKLRKFYHFDLYRLIDPEELVWIGIEDYLQEKSICFIEWPDKGDGYLTVPDVILTLSVREIGRELMIKKMPVKIYTQLRP